MKKLFILSFVLIFTFGCNNEENIQLKIDVVDEPNVPFQVSNMRPLIDEEVSIITNYLSNKKVSFDIEEALFVSYENLKGNSVFIPTYDGTKSSDEIEQTTLLFMDNKQNIIDYAIHEKITKESIIEINIYNSCEKVINTIVDKETYEILEVNYLNDSSKGGWSACATCAAKSCANDGECAFICGIVWKECISAIAIACLFSDLEC